MELNHITEESCSECGSPTVSEEVKTDINGHIRHHVHGGRWELRKFACGRKLKYTPNFSEVVEVGQCKKSSKYQKILENRILARDKVISYISKMKNVDTTFRREMVEEITNCPIEFNVPSEEDRNE